jgi:alpha-ribazole phosphatase
LKFIFVRHPETEALANKIIYGQTHSPYTKKGELSVPWVSEQLEGEDVKLIYSSPLDRAKTLAEGIAGRHPGQSVHVDDRLKEMSVGIFEQMTFQEADAAHPLHARPFLEDFGNYRVPGSELFSEVRERVSDFLKDVLRREDEEGKEEHPERPVIVVSHAMAIRGALAYLFDAELSDLWHLRINPASIIRVKYKEGFAQLTGMSDPHDIL